MLRMTVGVWALRDVDGEVTQLRGGALQGDGVLVAERVPFVLDLDAAKAFHGRVEDHVGLEIHRRIFSGNASDADAPASTLAAAGNFDELGLDVDAVVSVVNGLATASAHVVLFPAVASHAVVLLAGMSEV